MRKRVQRKQRSLASSTRIPKDPVGELARSNIEFTSKVKVLDNSKPTLKEFTTKELQHND